MSQFNIIDFPTEILENIFCHFDDTTNATAAGLCKRFNEIINETIRRKYNGSSRSKWYNVEIFDGSTTNERHEIVQHRPFILKRVSAIKLTFHTGMTNQNHWIYQMIDRMGRNIRMICLETRMIDAKISFNFYNFLSKTPNVSHLCTKYIYPTNRKWCHLRYKKLTHLEMNVRTPFDENELKSFVKNNGQLESVKLTLNDFRLLFAFDQSKIESLDCRFSHCTGPDIAVDIPPIRMANLKSMNLEVPKGALNECIEKIVAPCQQLKELCLMHFNSDRDVQGDELTDASVDILCNFRSLESFTPCFSMSLQNILRFIAQVPTLVTVKLWYTAFTTGDYRMLLEVANKHSSLRKVCFSQRMSDVYNHTLLSWLMTNINDRIQLEYSICYKLVVFKGKVQYDGVTIMSTNGAPIDYEKMTSDWLRHLELTASFNEDIYEFFSNLPIPIIQALFVDDSVLHLSDETSETSVKHRGKGISVALTKLTNNREKSVDHINWLEKYCRQLQELTICTEDNHQDLPAWTFPELNTLRISCQKENLAVDACLFASLNCLRLNSLKIVGYYPIRLTNIRVVDDIDLFDNLVTLQIFHFNESSVQLLERFNQNVQNNLRYLTVANRRVHWDRYKMNNQTITAISRYTNLIQLKIILPAINETNTKYLFENCTKLSELSFECNFLTDKKYDFHSYDSKQMFADIRSNCNSLRKLQLVWHDRMMDANKAGEIKRTFPNVLVQIMQVDDHMYTTAAQIIRVSDTRLERLFEEFEV